MKRQAGRIVVARALEAAALDLEGVELAVAAGVEPLADLVAHQRRLGLVWPGAAVGGDAARVLDPVDQHIGRLRRDDELHRLEGVHHERHTEAAARRAAPVEEAAFRLGLEVGFENRLVFRRERRLLTLAPRLVRIERGLPLDTRNDLPGPLPAPVRKFRVGVPRLLGGRGDTRADQQRRRYWQCAARKRTHPAHFEHRSSSLAPAPLSRGFVIERYRSPCGTTRSYTITGVCGNAKGAGVTDVPRQWRERVPLSPGIPALYTPAQRRIFRNHEKPDRSTPHHPGRIA